MNGGGGQVCGKQFWVSAQRRHHPWKGHVLRKGMATPVGCLGKARCDVDISLLCASYSLAHVHVVEVGCWSLIGCKYLWVHT